MELLWCKKLEVCQFSNFFDRPRLRLSLSLTFKALVQPRLDFLGLDPSLQNMHVRILLEHYETARVFT